MDYRKAWDEVKAKIEDALEEGYDNGYDDTESDTRESGMYEAYKRVLDHMASLASQIPGVIKVGDTVRIVNCGEVYSCYSDWIRANIDNPFLAAKWASYRQPKNNAVGVVKVIAPHGSQDRDLAYVEIGNACYIMWIEALELIEEG